MSKRFVETKGSSLKRHPGLRPFARDHGVGLLCVQRLRQAARATRRERIKFVEQMQLVFSDILTLFLLDELQVLVPMLARTGYAHRFLKHHQRIRYLIACVNELDESEDPGVGLLSMLGNALDDYVRWEENILFPAIEKMLNDEELAWLVGVTQPIEESRCRPTQALNVSIAGAYPCAVVNPRSNQQWQIRRRETGGFARKMRTAIAV
ncbi:MAG: hemerythrin domain-containing protein [Candidatus Melainabacteria bacterium]|nr:hemerythrin domain-containing protein [Candidatus Melainabacteria bacterium]